MNGKEALMALADGERITRSPFPDKYIRYDRTLGALVHESGSQARLSVVLEHDDWRVWHRPLTDAELISEWELWAGKNFAEDNETATFVANVFQTCARQLRERRK
jgi:hypothetical protein